MKDIIIGFGLLFTIPSCLYFWRFFVYLEKSKQINLKGIDKK